MLSQVGVPLKFLNLCHQPSAHSALNLGLIHLWNTIKQISYARGDLHAVFLDNELLDPMCLPKESNNVKFSPSMLEGANAARDDAQSCMKSSNVKAADIQACCFFLLPLFILI